jgi:hypothetical protein
VVNREITKKKRKIFFSDFKTAFDKVDRTKLGEVDKYKRTSEKKHHENIQRDKKHGESERQKIRRVLYKK